MLISAGAYSVITRLLLAHIAHQSASILIIALPVGSSVRLLMGEDLLLVWFDSVVIPTEISRAMNMHSSNLYFRVLTEKNMPMMIRLRTDIAVMAITVEMVSEFSFPMKWYAITSIAVPSANLATFIHLPGIILLPVAAMIMCGTVIPSAMAYKPMADVIID